MVEAMGKNGFKQTDIGLIPKDWTLEPFTEIASLKHGFQFLEEHFSKLGIGVIKIANIKDGAGLNLSDLTFAPFGSMKRFEKFKLTKGDVLMALTGATLGKVCRVDTDRTLLQNYRVGNFIPNDKTIKDYIYHVSQSEIVQQIVKDLVNSGAQPNLGKKDFDKILIPLPPTKAEQTAIATALNDADALITQLEKLIAKKRNIKQGAMQELLRLKEGWKVKKLGDVLKVRHGKSQTEVNSDNGIYPILASGGVIGKAIRFLYNKPSVLIGRKGTIDKPQFMNTPFWTVDTLFYTEIFENYDAKFIFYMFNLIDWYSYNEASGVPSLNAKTIELIERGFPRTKGEQIHIAQILSDMDTEIEAFEKKLEKYKMLKQGMMQNLLTGKIRLV